MRVRTARSGSVFLGCSSYPKCTNAIPVAVQGGKPEARPAEPTGEKCPVCGHDLVKRHGRFGEYVSCSNYPECRYKPPKPVTLTGVVCPECGKGQILERRGRFGPFYGCSRYPECTRNFKVRPVPKACPQCGAPYLLVRERKSGVFYSCDKEGCGYDAAAEDLERYPVHTEVTEEARQAALAAAVAPVAPPKRKRRPKAPVPTEAPATAPELQGKRAAARRPRPPREPRPAARSGGRKARTPKRAAAPSRRRPSAK
jgi:DNA topoisomerase-1